jgi:sarcosine oxidase
VAGTGRAVVVGAGVFGSWTALWLRRRGWDVALVDAYGPGNSLSSSGDESRVTRSAHGSDDHYPRWQRRALGHWQALEGSAGGQLFHRAGVVWFAHDEAGFEAASLATLERLGIAVERWSPDEIASRCPGAALDGIPFAMYEPDGGALMARRGVAAVADRLVREGGRLVIGRARAREAAGERVDGVELATGERLGADAVVFACGSWLATVLAPVMENALAVTRQEVLFVAPPPGDDRWSIERMPVWVDYDRAFYGIPSVEARGFKLAPDWPGERVDPDRQERVVGAASIAATRAFLAERFPALAEQPIAEGRVCQYESTPDSHFIIDRHPAWTDAWVVGGGSGHGFKHGPVVGEYVAALVSGDAATAAELAPDDDRFAFRPRQPIGGGLRTVARPPAATIA